MGKFLLSTTSLDVLTSWVEQEAKDDMTCYGRAATMWPRTMEILDQLDLADGLLQVGIVTRDSMHFRDGKRFPGGYLFATRMDKLGMPTPDTFFKFALQVRQRWTEEEFSAALAKEGVQPHLKTRIEGFTINEGAEDGYPVTVQARDLAKDEVFQIKTKYLIGADGARSTVRALAGIPFVGERTTNRFIRIDALVKTDLPNCRSLNSIDSKSHGQILWCPLDGGFTRIGYVFSQALIEKYGGLEGVTQEVIANEAIEALKPFKLEFVQIDWFTLYGVGQAIAETFFTQNRVFLAGDACHTHSSGAAQGLNTGIHDAVNLSWKLALNLLSLGKKTLLNSYTEERKPSAQKVIDNDKTISTLMAGQYPPRFQGRKEHPRCAPWNSDLLTEWYTDSSTQMFTDSLNVENMSSAATITPGHRGPDVYLSCVGTGTQIRLHQVLKNDAKFHIVVFAGTPALSSPAIRELNSALNATTAFTHVFPATQVFRFTTLTAATGNSTTDVLGVPPFGGGRLYFDPEARAHAIYGVDVSRGAIIVFRPDGWVGCVVALEDVHELGQYFGEFLVPISD
ncbi:FAD binding domain-containing protein [Mycena maculata]|uniref:FAD binding domain-containing protein n=1 Tax=Mycena maculata TaxID=230809 RepID=A0AAD7IY42_9AGAR|nr:FAD binding domain-containing protein [Mycena maculata]